MTSHDVVARVRRILDGPKVGHAGTLDPDATGVLVLCVGKATKVSSFLMEGVKEYQGVGRLGVSTETQDASGAVVLERPVQVSDEELQKAAAKFTGAIEQIPPMYSALKVAGEKLYRLARKGVEVERSPRPVVVHSFEIESVELPEFRFTLRCSKGTYVRTLVHDLGEALGCGGHLASLKRSAQGNFELSRAVSWEACTAADAAQTIRRVGLAPEDALDFLPAYEAPAGAETARVGMIVPVSEEDRARGELVRIVLRTGRVDGVGKLGEEGLRILHRFPLRTRYGRGPRAT